MASKLENDYTPAQCDKFLYNHEKYIGDEDCAAIFGLVDLNNIITVADQQVALRDLLKNIPAIPGMSRNKMFQVVDPNSNHTCTIVTFQKHERNYIEQQKPLLESLLRITVGEHQAHLIFLNLDDGIRFVGAIHKNRGKDTRVHDPFPDHLAFIHRVDSLLSSPPKKRLFQSTPSSSQKHAPPTTAINYRGILQSQTT
jgi:hypothetical protein